MSASNYIPTGRTSLAKKGDVAFQIQTEYASRPTPRITTTILKSGQVVHKIERNLTNTIESIEEMNRMEVAIRKQHSQVVEIIQKGGTPGSETSSKSDSVKRPVTAMDRLNLLPGRHRIFRLDNEGKFESSQASDIFKEVFAEVFKSLHELIAVFAKVPGVGFSREQGVCEVERNCLYLASSGTDLYLFYLLEAEPGADYEKLLKDALGINSWPGITR